VLSLERLAAEPTALRGRILRQWLEQSESVRDVGFHHVHGLLALSEGRLGGDLEIPGKVKVKREGNQLRLETKLAAAAVFSYCYTVGCGQQLMIAKAGWRVSITVPAAWQGALQQACLTNPWQAIFDAAILPDTFVVRSYRPGDHIRPLGMQGRKKVRDIFIDAKVPVAQRRLLPLIATDEEVVWVPGYVRGEAAKVTSATRWVCQIAVNPLPEK
jgi:tRNA(Ile)-lysidine synthase